MSSATNRSEIDKGAHRNEPLARTSAGDSSNRNLPIKIGAREEEFLTEHELAARHQRSVKTIRNLRLKGGYIVYVKIGRHVRYRLSDVIAFEEAHVQLSTTVAGGRDAR